MVGKPTIFCFSIDKGFSRQYTDGIHMNDCSYIEFIQEVHPMPKKVYIIENLDCANCAA